MQRLEVSGAVRPIYGSLGVKRLNRQNFCRFNIIWDPSDYIVDQFYNVPERGSFRGMSWQMQGFCVAKVPCLAMG